MGGCYKPTFAIDDGNGGSIYRNLVNKNRTHRPVDRYESAPGRDALRRCNGGDRCGDSADIGSGQRCAVRPAPLDGELPPSVSRRAYWICRRCGTGPTLPCVRCRRARCRFYARVAPPSPDACVAPRSRGSLRFHHATRSTVHSRLRCAAKVPMLQCDGASHEQEPGDERGR